MGVYYYVYLGPYAVCKNPKRMEQVPHRGCLKQGCAKHKRDVTSDVSFCSGCGEPVGQWVTSREASVVSFYDLFNYDPLCQLQVEGDRREYLTPNVSRNPPRKFNLGERTTGAVSVTPEMIVAEIEWFKKAFASEIEVVLKAYGAENVEIGWGCLQYAS